MDDLVATTCWKTIGKQVLLVNSTTDQYTPGCWTGCSRECFTGLSPDLARACGQRYVSVWAKRGTPPNSQGSSLLLNGHVRGIHQFQTKPFVVRFGCLSCDVLTWLWKIIMCCQSWKFSLSLHLSFSIKTNAPRTHIACVPATFGCLPNIAYLPQRRPGKLSLLESDLLSVVDLVGGLEHFLFSIIYGIIFPIE